MRKKKPHRVNSGAESPDYTGKDHETCCSKVGTNMGYRTLVGVVTQVRLYHFERARIGVFRFILSLLIPYIQSITAFLGLEWFAYYFALT